MFELKAAALALQFANASQVDVMMSVMQTAAAARNQRLIFHGEMHTRRTQLRHASDGELGDEAGALPCGTIEEAI